MEEQLAYYIRFMTASTGGQRGGGAFQPWKSIIFMSIHYINSSFRHFQRVFPGVQTSVRLHNAPQHSQKPFGKR